EWSAAASGRTFDTVNPATGGVLAEVAEAGEADVDRAVAAAREAFTSSSWRRLSGRERGRLLNRIADLLERDADRRGNLETRMTIARKEIFGPVLAVIPVADEEEAVAIANASVYAFAAAVWTQEVGKAHRIAHALEAGTVWINTYHGVDPGSPFGGYRQSGYGRELGRQALDLYTQVKSIWVNLR